MIPFGLISLVMYLSLFYLIFRTIFGYNKDNDVGCFNNMNTKPEPVKYIEYEPQHMKELEQMMPQEKKKVKSQCNTERSLW